MDNEPTVPSPVPPYPPSLPPTASMRPPPPAPPPKKQLRSSTVLAFGCAGFVLLAVGGLVALAALGDTASVDDGTVLKLTLSGDVPEYVASSGLDELFGEPAVTVHQHLMNLKKAAADKRVKGVVLKVEPLLIGWAKVEELRDALVEFKKSGKFVIAWAEVLDEKSYALALAADEIVMPTNAPFEFNGLATDISHYPGLLEKLGVEVQYFRYGKYKSVSGEQLGRKAFTEPVKEMINANLDLTYAHFVDAVALYRKLDRDQVRALLDEGHLSSSWAAEQKLIDRLAYWDEVEDTVKAKTGVKADGRVKWVSATKYRKVSPGAAGLDGGKGKLALIYSVGLIVAGRGGDGALGEATQGSQPIIDALRRALEDEDVKAIVLRVDSPGGAGLGCDYVRREVEKAKAKKPVIVSMSDVAASGGYWVSMSATAIVAQPTTATGSIGIFSVVPNLGGLYDKLGLNNETFKRGAHADAIIGARALTDDEAKAFDAELRQAYDHFVDLAAKGRGKTFDELQELAQGRTWYGEQALANGLVDKLGGFPVAYALAKEKAGLPVDKPVEVELFDRRRTFFEELTKGDDDEEEDGPTMGAALLTRVVDTSGLGLFTRRLPGFSAFARTVLEGKERLFPMMEHRVDHR